MDEKAREELRGRCQFLLDVMRPDPGIQDNLWELLSLLVSRLDRLETGRFGEGEEITRMERKPTPSPFQAVGEIFDQAKKKA